MPLRNIYIIVTAVVLSLVCYHRSDSKRRNEHSRMFATFSKAMTSIETEYVQEIDRQKVFEGALRGMVSELDEYSAYFDPEEYRELRENLDQEFGGIGIQVTLDEESKQLMVMSPLVGTPAYRAGVLAGDRIVAIDGQSTEGFTLSDAVQLLRGKRGEPVTLSLQHDGAKQPKDVEIVRDIIQVATVHGDSHGEDDQWNYFLEGTDRIGYVRVSAFGEKTREELLTALNWLEERNVRGVVIDLRNNPGGLLTTAVQVSDLFIKSGVIVSTRGRDGVPQSVYRASQGTTHPEYPIAVLTNRFSASASEIVAACLKDHGRAVIVGERTWGKGSVQNVIELRPEVDALKITVATYWRPSGKNIHRWPDAKPEDDWGVRPTKGYEVEMKTEDFRELLQYRRRRDIVRGAGAEEDPRPEEALKAPLEVDPQLKKAVEYLEGLDNAQAPAPKTVKGLRLRRAA